MENYREVDLQKMILLMFLSRNKMQTFAFYANILYTIKQENVIRKD
jgi:hypothetical protein